MDWVLWLAGLLIVVLIWLILIAVIISCWAAAKINQDRYDPKD